MLKLSRFVRLTTFSLIVLTLGGCTEEKAIALKAAAEAFRDKATEAIDAFRELHILGAIGRQAESTQVQDGVRQIRAIADARRTVTNAEIDGAVSQVFARDDAEARITALADTKQAYVEFGAAFARLPEGSALAANAVACSTVLGARLVHRLTLFHDTLADAPIDYFSDRSEAKETIRKAAQAGNGADVEKAALAYIELRKTIQRDNAEARKKLAQAAEAGQQVLELMKNYNALSVADFLAGTSRILEIRSKHLGMQSDMSLQRVNNIRQSLENDAKLGPILKLRTADITECKN